MEKFLKTAITSAKAAGRVHLQYFQKELSIKTKGASFNRVTKVDILSEQVIVERIKKVFPDHNILAEESTYPAGISDFTWIVDPLDGTNNFSHRMPFFCASVAVSFKGRVFAAAVFDPIRKELFYASKGRGAYLNGKRIRVSPGSSLKDSLLITGFYYDRGKEMVENLEKIKQFFYKQIIGIRRFGAAALDLCYVASARAGGFWEFKLSPWDFAAGDLIVREAGGRVTDRKEKQLQLRPSFVVASNGRIHGEMIRVLNQRKA